MKNLIYLVLIIGVVFLIYKLVVHPNNQDLVNNLGGNSTEYLKFVEDEFVTESSQSYVIGKLENTSDKEIQNVIVSAEFFDANQKSLKGSQTVITTLAPGEIKEFKITLFGGEADPNIRSYKLTTSIESNIFFD